MRNLASIGALLFVTCLLLAGAHVGCSVSIGFGDDGGAGDDGGSTSDGGNSSESGTLPGSDSGPPLMLGCSADLHDVIDGQGHVIKMCAADEGCDKGACVPACQAAADSKGSVGCDFFVATPSFQQQIQAPCFAVFLANNWPRPVKITVARAGMTYDITKFGRMPVNGMPESSWPTVPPTGLPQDQVAVLFLSSDPNAMNGPYSMHCPVADAVGASTAVSTTGRGQAFHIVTDTPVSAYDIHPYGGANSFLPSAELLLPTSALGVNYVAAVPRNGDYQNGGVADGPQWAQVVGTADNTTVKIVPNVALPAGTNVNAAPANTVTTYTLNAGEYIQWQPPWSPGSGAPMELSGTIVSSDKPVAFVGGNGYLCLKSSTNVTMFGGAYGGCDSGHQEIPPVAALGSEYAVAPYATRRMDLMYEAIIYRMVGAVAGTTLKYDPPVTGAPATIGAGQMIDFQASGPFVVSSQDANHPFYVAQMMSGAFTVSGSRPGATNQTSGVLALGDEEYVNVLPPAQFLPSYVFFTDPTYPTTNLVLVRTKTANGFSDVTVDCIGKVSGWKPVGTSGKYETTDVDLLRAAMGPCKNGGHSAKSDGPFGMTVWGLDSFSSYAYPAGGNVAPINSVVVPPTPK